MNVQSALFAISAVLVVIAFVIVSIIIASGLMFFSLWLRGKR
jgi:hypothetical protein